MMAATRGRAGSRCGRRRASTELTSPLPSPLRLEGAMGRRGTNNSAVPKPADTNARPSYFEEDGLRKVEPYQCVRPAPAALTQQLLVHHLRQGALAGQDPPRRVSFFARCRPTHARAASPRSSGEMHAVLLIQSSRPCAETEVRNTT